ncbi:TPA: hypothetical protein DEG21_02240 [Patescibacteria group bacterium]|nr:hypothetical protein [Candidatus Gracilibacteria bacterium]
MSSISFGIVIQIGIIEIRFFQSQLIIFFIILNFPVGANTLIKLSLTFFPVNQIGLEILCQSI